MTDDEELRKIWRGKLRNLKLAWNEFEEKKPNLASTPFKFVVELTQNCNFKCSMCPQSSDPAFKSYRPEYNMPLETFTKIADQLFPKAIMVDLRGFGETTLLPHWPEAVQYLDRFPFVLWHLVTNLSFPRKDIWDKMMKLGFVLGFSCDGATKETFEFIRKRSHFDKIMDNLSNIRDLIKQHDNGRIYFISTIQRSNLHELRKLVELAHRFDVDEVQFKVVQGEFKAALANTDRTVIRDYVNAALAAAVDLGVQVTFNDWIFTRDADPEIVKKAESTPLRSIRDPLPRSPSFDPTYWEEQGIEPIYRNILQSVRVSEHQRCFKPFSFTYVNYKGEVGTCNHMMYPDMLVMGDLSHQPMAKIWNGPRYKAFRKELVAGKPSDVRCQWCFKHRLQD